MDLKEKRGLERGKWLSMQGKLHSISSHELRLGHMMTVNKWCVRVYHKLDIAEGAEVSLNTQNPSKLHV